MSLIAFHKFLISTAIVFCLIFSIRQFLDFKATGDGLTLVTGIAFGIAAVGLGIYLRHLGAVLKIPTEREGFGSSLRSDPKGFVQTFLRPTEPPIETLQTTAGNGRSNFLRWARSLLRPSMPSRNGKGRNGHEPN